MITGSVSCSYQNSTFFSQSATPTYSSPGSRQADFNQEFKFKDNTKKELKTMFKVDRRIMNKLDILVF